MSELERADQNKRRQAAALKLRLDAAAAEVLQALDQHDVAALLLKGPAIVTWLYPDSTERPYVDCDLLIDPKCTAMAQPVLASLGYEQQFDDSAMPLWWREHSTEWVRAGGGVTLDVHRTLPGIHVSPEVAWSALGRRPDRVLVAGYRAATLTLPGRALHVALHAAQHGAMGLQSIRDLERAAAVATADTWAQAAELAAELRAVDAFTAGLRLVPAGMTIADSLGLPRASSVDAMLRARGAPEGALALERLAQAGGLRARAAIVARKVFPPQAYMYQWDPRATSSRTALVRAYIRRPLWVGSRLPRAVTAWLKARRGSKP